MDPPADAHADDDDGLPPSTSPLLHLSHPTPEESVQISTNTFASWKDSLTLPAYLEESRRLATAPLARNGGLTAWILVDATLPPNARPVLCSCESFRKRALTADAAGNVRENIVHGVASVFCPPARRGRGYAARLMREMAAALRGWQTTTTTTTSDGKDVGRGVVVGSVLYSDIGRAYYARLGWHPHPTNAHVVLRPRAGPASPSPSAEEVAEGDLAALCERDEEMVRGALGRAGTRRVTIVPDLDHMLWHIRKEDFAAERLFGRVPRAKGAVAGPPGARVWAVWARRYYRHPEAAEPPCGNVLYVLRLVVEGGGEAAGDATSSAERVGYLRAVLQAARAEAAEWRLDDVELWVEPASLVMDLITRSGLEHSVVEREEEGIASALWYDGNGGVGPAPRWLNNERYAWC